MIFADGTCPKCGELCGNRGGDRLQCSCGWISEPLDLNFPPPIKTPLGEWFKAYRRKHGIAIDDARRAMDCNPSDISKIECRGRIPSLDEIAKFVYAFDVSVEDAAELLELHAGSGNRNNETYNIRSESI